MKSMSVVGSCAPIVTNFWYVSASVPWPFLDMPWWVTFALGIRLVDVVAGVTAAIITTLYVMADVVVIQGANVVVQIAIGVLDELYRVAINVSVLCHTITFIKRLHFLQQQQNPSLRRLSTKKRDESWWWTWIPYPIRNGAINALGRVACMIAYLMEDVFNVFSRAFSSTMNSCYTRWGF